MNKNNEFIEQLDNIASEFKDKPDGLKEYLMHSIRVDSLLLSIRARKGLKYIGVETIGQLLRLSVQDLTSIPNFGRKSQNEVKEVISVMTSAVDHS